MKIKKIFTLIECSSFLILIFIILLNFLVNDSEIISHYEKMAGHSINKFTVKIILLFKDLMLIILTSLILIAIYLKSRYKKSKNNGKNNILIGLLFPIIVFLLMQLFFTHSFLDDSFISFRYAENFFETGQLTFNVGEAPIEGYTHPLWILLLQIPQFLGINILLFTKLMGLSFSLAGLILVYILSDRNIVATWLYILSSSVIGWSMTGLETPMYTALSLFFIHLFLKEKYLLSSLILFLVNITRPEGLVLIFPAIFILIKYESNLFRNLSKLILPFSLTYSSYMLWKYSYFGNLLPNTFYAKYIFLSGMPIIKQFIFFLGPIIFVLLIYFVHTNIFQNKKSEKEFYSNRKDVFFILCIFLTILSYLNLTPISGSYNRFFQLPLILIYIITSKPIKYMFATAFSFADKNRAQLFFLCLIVLFFGFMSLDVPQAIVYFNIHYDGLEKAHKNLAEFLNNQYSGKNYTVAISDLGVFSYYSEFNIIDIQGLTDGVLSKGFNFTYLMYRNPEIIILDSSSKFKFMQDKDVNAINGEDLMIYNNQIFQEKYIFTNITYEHSSNIVLWLFKKRGI